MLESVAASAVPFILAGLGGLLSEQAGVLNISLEGCITLGAFATALLITLGISAPLAVCGVLILGASFGLLLSGIHMGLKANLFIAGMGINILIPSLSGLISNGIWGHKGTLHIAGDYILSPIPWLMIPLALLFTLLLHRNYLGIRFKAAGLAPEFLSERAISPNGIKISALAISSAMASLAGAFLTMRVEAYVPGMSSGRGWIALVLIWLGFRNPLGILISSYFFSLIIIISNMAQGNITLPATMLKTLPYIAALIAFTVASARRPAARFPRKRHRRISGTREG